ncbi:MAG: hypothetical protein JW718_08580 [Desulfovibrionaceae bacterium]|nr:hypothetical protein [Desulfovibrionaceae bacterium]
MSETVDELTVNYEEDGLLLVRELDKAVLSKGAWTTILFRYQEWDRAKQDYGPEKYSVRRYQKQAGTYRPKSKFTISSAAQARKMIDILSAWTGDA